MKKAIVYVFRILISFIYTIYKTFGFKEKGIVISGYKAKYLVGNNEYLFNYLVNNSEYDFYFYTKDRAIYKQLSAIFPNKIIYPYTLKAFIILLRSKVIVLTSGYDDLSPFPILDDKIIINMWHGIPMKSIGVKGNKKVLRDFYLFTKSINYYTVSSNYDKEILRKIYKLPKDNVVITGLQNNDFIKKSHNSILINNEYLKEYRVILYAPTYREKEMSLLDFSELVPIDQLNQLLEKYNAYFLYRSHFNTDDIHSLRKYPRIKSASTDIFPSAQSLLYYSDILITDYSGIFFDFLLMDRPIIFYNYDIEDYKKYRGLIMDYEENTPGPKVKTQEDLLAAIEDYLIKPEKDAEFRAKIKKRFHKYTDGKACERTYNLIKELM